MQVFQADRTVLVCSLRYAYVVSRNRFSKAAATTITVLACFTPTGLAHPTFVTVIDALFIAFIVIERAWLAVILAKFFLTTLASS